MLVFEEPTRALAEHFHAGELAPSALDAHPVLARWARSARLGLRPDSAAHAEGTSGADLAGRRDRLADLFREQHAMLEPIAAELAERALVAIVADPDGIILAARGGGEFAQHASRVALVEGARWSEGARGTNAIGTALAEGCAVAVLGSAHYELRNRGLFCYATPVRDAYGDAVAVLDVTGRIECHDPAVGIAVQASAAALEGALRARAYAATSLGGLAVIERLVSRCAAPTMLVEANGAVRFSNDAAYAALRAGTSGTSLTCEAVFGTSFDGLARVARDGGRIRFETRWASFRIDLDPIAGPGGRVLAMLVHFEPMPSVGRISEPPPAAPARPRAREVTHPAFAAILGDDAQLAEAKSLAAHLAPTALPVLLLAETGTGKELFARAIHAASKRARGPFVALNCGALVGSLLESEVFGHAPGAFTGAARGGSEGKLGAASGGTLFLDEIAEMPEAMQVALLRVLDDGVYYRVGEARPRSADLRLLCATCRDLPALVERGAFRRDLFFRIQGACVTLPPLRARSDKRLLARALLERLASDAGIAAPAIDEEALAWIDAHTWPGNVRELKSALAHALALADGGTLERAHFPRPLVGEGAAERPDSRPPPSGGTRDAIVHDAILEAVRACAGNVSEAARRLGVARTTVYRALGKIR